MSFTGPGSSQSPQPSYSNLTQQKQRAEALLRGTASWFLWVAILSVVNSLISFTGGHLRFIFGLGVAQLIDGMAKGVGPSGPVLDLIINGCIAGVFVIFWHFGCNGQSWAFYIGMGLYLIDALILLGFNDYLGAAFHAYVLFRLYGGIKGLSMLHQAQRGFTHA